jgi:hypothetical protein
VALVLTTTERQEDGNDAINQRVGAEEGDEDNQRDARHGQRENAEDDRRETAQPHCPPMSRE